MKKEPAIKEFYAMARAIGKYIEAMGGTALVVGGVEVEKTAKFLYTLRIGITGKPPTKKNV